MFLDLRLGLGTRVSTALAQALIDYRDWKIKAVTSEYVTDGVELVINNIGDFTNSNSVSNEVDGYLELEALTQYGNVTQSLNLKPNTKYHFVIEGELLTSTSAQVKVNSNYIEMDKKPLGNTLAKLELNFTTSSNVSNTNLEIQNLSSGLGTIRVKLNIIGQKVIQEPNKRYITNKGTSNTPLALNSGSGVYFNGVDQYIGSNSSRFFPQRTDDVLSYLGSFSMPIATAFRYVYFHDYRFCCLQANAGVLRVTTYQEGVNINYDVVIASEFIRYCVEVGTNYFKLFIDEVLILNESVTSFNTNFFYAYTINGAFNGGSSANVTQKDNYIFNRALTQTEITKNYSQPEQFFIDAKNDDTCVLNMPMNEDQDGAYSGHVINYSEFSLGSEEDTGIGTFTDATSGSRLNQHSFNPSSLYLLAKVTLTNITAGAVRIIVGGLEHGGELSKEGDSFVVVKLNSIGAADVYCRAVGTTTSNVSWELFPLSGIHEITNKTNDSRDLVLNIPYGLQNSKLDRDANGVIIGVSPYYEMDGKQVPAMSLDMTDSALGSKFVFDFVIERETLAMELFLLRTSKLWIRSNRSYQGSIIQIDLFDGNNLTAFIKYPLDSNPHHIIFEITETTLTMIVDGVAGTPVTHSLVPSGLNFKDSIQASPIGTLRHFKIYDEANFDKYDRQKAIDYIVNKGLLNG